MPSKERMDVWLTDHRKRERLCARTLKGRALLTVDCILNNIDWNSLNKSEDKLLSKLYRIVHCATGVCGNPHEDWVEELEATFKRGNDEQRD